MTLKPLDRERHLRWYMESESNPTVHHCSFVIVNTPGETERLKNRLRLWLRPTSDELTPTEGAVPGSKGLRYELLTIDSHNPEKPDSLLLAQIYRGRTVKDRNLKQYDSRDGRSNYVDNMFS